MTAKGMARLSEGRTAEFLKLELLVEKDHPTMPIKIGERDPDVVEIAGLVQKVMNETGEILLRLGKKDLGSFVADVLREGKDEESRADLLVRKVGRGFLCLSPGPTGRGAEAPLISIALSFPSSHTCTHTHTPSAYLSSSRPSQHLQMKG